MKWKVAALPRAQVDLLEAADWYDFTSMGLGVEFIKAVLADGRTRPQSAATLQETPNQEHSLA
jgi:hypothetical protein